MLCRTLLRKEGSKDFFNSKENSKLFLPPVFKTEIYLSTAACFYIYCFYLVTQTSEVASCFSFSGLGWRIKRFSVRSISGIKGKKRTTPKPLKSRWALAIWR